MPPLNRYSAFVSQTAYKVAVAASFAAIVLLNGCTYGSNIESTSPTASIAQPSESDEKKVILTTFTVLADMARNVAGDRAIVESLTKIGAEVHGYEPTPSDLAKAQDADLILDNGLGLERWAERFYNSVDQVQRITVSTGVQPLSITEGNYRNQPNPHAWMSPQNALIYVENIRKALVEIDPASEAIYNANAQKYSKEIEAIDQKLQSALAQLPDQRRYMVTCEGAFTYLTTDYNLKEIYLWPINAEQESTPQQIRQAIDKVKASQVPVVFCESTVNAEAQKQVARESGAKFGGVFYVDSLTDTNGDAPTYIRLLEYNVETLIKGLQGS